MRHGWRREGSSLVVVVNGFSFFKSLTQATHELVTFACEYPKSNTAKFSFTDGTPESILPHSTQHSRKVQPA